MSLPKNEKTFPFTATGDVTQQSYEGDFTVKCVLKMSEKNQLEIEKSRFRSDIVNPTADLIALSVVLANLKVRILKFPEWWKECSFGGDMLDENVIASLFDKVMDQEEVWRKELKDATGVKEGN